jgi:transposase InsO family protein
MDELEALSKKLGRLKGAAALHKEARKEGIPVTLAQVKDFVAAVPQKQLLAQGAPSLGKSATAAIKEEGSRWQADLVQFRFSAQDTEETDEEGGDEKLRYALLVINVFDRKAHGISIADKSAETVLSAFRKILKKLGGDMKGGVLSSDTGTEFRNEAFQQLLKASDIAWKSKGTSSPNDLAVIDRLIQTVRKDITSRLQESPEKSWSDVLNAVLVAYNRSIHGAMRDAPADVGREPVLQFLALSDNAKKYQANKALAKKRVQKVVEAGAFRRPIKANAFKRGFEAKWKEKEELEAVSDGTLLKAKGDERRIDVKSVLPVPVATDTRRERKERPGAMDRRRRDKTEDLIAVLDDFIRVGQTQPLRNAGPYIRTNMGDGVYDATLRSVNRNLAGVLELWPERYKLVKDNYYAKRLR